MRAIDALQIAQEVDKMDQKYLKVAQRITGLGVEVVRNNYYNETMWTVPMLKAAGCRFFTEVAVIRGLPQSAIQYPGRAEYERTKKDKKKSNANPDWSTIEFINTRHPSGYQVDFSTKTSPASPYSK